MTKIEVTNEEKELIDLLRLLRERYPKGNFELELQVQSLVEELSTFIF